MIDSNKTFKLDLDILQPQAGEITLGGKTYYVEPPKLKTVVRLSKIAQSFQRIGTDENVNEADIIDLLSDFKDALVPVVPEFVNDEVDINLTQAGALLTFIFEMASPADAKALKDEGITPNQKKTQTAPDLLS